MTAVPPSTDAEADGPAAGYYADPSIPGFVRYWDGLGWLPGTSRPAPLAGEELPPPRAAARRSAPSMRFVPPPIPSGLPSGTRAGLEESGPIYLDATGSVCEVLPDTPVVDSRWTADPAQQRGLLETASAPRWVTWGTPGPFPAALGAGVGAGADGQVRSEEQAQVEAVALGTEQPRLAEPDSGRQLEPRTAAEQHLAHPTPPALTPVAAPVQPDSDADRVVWPAPLPAPTSLRSDSEPLPWPPSVSRAGAGAPVSGGEAGQAEQAARPVSAAAPGRQQTEARGGDRMEPRPARASEAAGERSGSMRVGASPRPALLGRRFGARVVDLAVVAGAVAVVGVPLVQRAQAHLQDKIDAARTLSGATRVWLVDPTVLADAGLLLLAVLVVGLVYEALPTAAWGRTLGKALFGLRVVDRRTKRVPGLRAALARWASYQVLLLLGVGVIGLAWCMVDRPWRQCWHDKIARSYVVSKRSGTGGTRGGEGRE